MLMSTHLQAPEWLQRHGGTVEPIPDGKSWAVTFAGEPQYRLSPTPAEGKFSCQVVQTINGKRLDKALVYPSADEALQGGAEELRQALGW